MKHARYLYCWLFACIIIFTFSECSSSQKSSKNSNGQTSFKKMIDSQNFVFNAQSVTPLRGNFRNLITPYNVEITKDTLSSYLPYFGRAYNPPMNPTQSALDFTSTDFSYSVSSYKKNAWNIVIKPKDKSDIQQYSFIVYDNGSASLNVTSTSRDAISFSGNIEKNK